MYATCLARLWRAFLDATSRKRYSTGAASSISLVIGTTSSRAPWSVLSRVSVAPPRRRGEEELLRGGTESVIAAGGPSTIGLRRRIAATDGSPRPRARWGRIELGLLLAVAAGVVVRAVHVLSAPFPLNDGGLFFAMVRDLQRADYLLPPFTSYNAADIPFAYPPLGFYLAGLLEQLTPLDLVDVFRWLPLAATSLTIVACWLLARELLPSRTAVVAAV